MVLRVESLNATVDVGAVVVSDGAGGVARFASASAFCLPLAFFRDGVKLGSADFAAYDTPAAQQLVRDILDGYFPYVLKATR